MAHIHTHLLVHGLVQGVHYRASMVQEARRLGVSGWVRNRRDGTVEAQVSGRASEVQALVEWARRGPQEARVDRLDVRDTGVPDDLPAGFEQRPTR